MRYANVAQAETEAAASRTKALRPRPAVRVPSAARTAMKPAKTARREKLRKVLVGCGVLSSVLYIGADVYAWTQYPGYSPVSQAFSELLAEGAPTRLVMLAVVGIPYNLLVAALGVGLEGRVLVDQVAPGEVGHAVDALRQMNRSRHSVSCLLTPVFFFFYLSRWNL